MRLGYYSIDKEDILDLAGELAGELDRIAENMKKTRLFSIGGVTDGDEGDLLGVLQFHLDIDEKSGCYAFLDYVYVRDEYRGQGIGAKLVRKADRILKMSGIETCITDIEEGKDGESFLKECGFIYTRSYDQKMGKENAKNARRFVRFIGK